jgi:GNAT superfamily N-acetyltransferase
MTRIADFDFVRLSPDSDIGIGGFTCGDEDLDGFLKDDACFYLQQLLAVTYLFKASNTIVAFFSVLNDSIAYEDGLITNSAWRKFFRDKLPYPKRNHKSFPSVKLGRLGVHTEYKRTGIGTEILLYIKTSFVTNNKTGCRFITVDAYNNPITIAFYEKNGFKFFPSDKDAAGQKTRLMYFDLRPFRDALAMEAEGTGNVGAPAASTSL